LLVCIALQLLSPLATLLLTQFVKLFNSNYFTCYFISYSIIYAQSEGFLRWCTTLRITGFVGYVLVRNSKYKKTQTFRNWISILPPGEGRETHTLLGHIKRAQINQWTWRLALSKGHNRVGVSLPSPEDGNRSSFRNVVFSSYLEFWTMHKAQKPSDSEC
jgi:hypothetical protein